jgi:serine/threonine protein kinase
MTNNFEKLLGKGGFGLVHYGRQPNGLEVAVKRLSTTSHQGAVEFFNEVDLLSTVHHKNLVSLIGYCQQDNERILIYEYMPNGTLRESLYGTERALENPLNWKTRLNIALNAAQGLEYLHKSCKHPIIHRDVKSSNILLSTDMVAKVADFGLSKITMEEGVSHVSTLVKGTAGYLDPEYVSSFSIGSSFFNRKFKLSIQLNSLWPRAKSRMYLVLLWSFCLIVFQQLEEFYENEMS